MLIWLDGTYGVGKTTVAKILKEQLRITVIDSDYVYQKEWVPSKRFVLGGGAWPQNNVNFLNYFKEKIEETDYKNNMVLIVMALTMDPCRELLFEPFHKQGNGFHIILTADKEAIADRILQQDDRADKETAINLISSYNSYLENHYPKALRIDTTNMAKEEVVAAIIEAMHFNEHNQE